LLTWDEIQIKAVAFAKRWQDAWDEKSEAQSFIRDLLAVFGVADAAAVGRFEERALRDEGRGFMDYFWPKQIAIEMKTRGKDLALAYEQLKEYVLHLPAPDMPDLLMVSDFAQIILYRRATGEKFAFKTKDLRKHIRRFANIAGYETTREIEDQLEVNVHAAEKMARLHDALKGHGYEGHDLEVYLVRLLFCLFAEDTGIFPQQAFLNYTANAKEDGSDLSERIGKLFEVLNMPEETRAKRTLLSAELRQFRYINGGLFKDLLPSAEFDGKMRGILLECCHFDWNTISPAIFGAMFQGVMDKNQRRELGAHYTSEENILKLINPLFMDALWQEFDRVKTSPAALEAFHDTISRLKFLDPACGCGNFLIITYRELRRLELEILKIKASSRQRLLDIAPLMKVTVTQFYGIEYEDFPCQIAQAGMWLMDHQMNLRVADQFGCYYARLPLTESATIVHGNALRLDWQTVVPREELSYILGNPPFVGYSFQNPEQKADIELLSKAKNIDYVAAWYYKAAEYIQGTHIKCAFVSTNSITQGEQVAAVWEPLFKQYAIHIDFAYRTFKWNNEAKGRAAVHCVIVGFSNYQNKEDKAIFEGDGTKKTATNINAYLVEAPDIFIESRTKPLCDVPEMQKGSIPVDNGSLIIEKEEIDILIEKEPGANQFIKRLIGSIEFINNIPRYCLWLVDIPPNTIRKMPEIIKRVEQCRDFRLKSKKEATRKFADFPMRFMEIRQPQTNYLAVPKVSSERRRYIPIGFLSPEIIATDLLFVVPNANLFHFGMLTSNIHMAWTRIVCGRLKSDYRYSNKIVYNNFPWPDATDEQKAAIEKLAQAVLDARALFPDSSLADLYDPLTMPPELLKAHKTLDNAVMKLYGFATNMTEAEIVAKLMERYQEMITRVQTG